MGQLHWTPSLSFPIPILTKAQGISQKRRRDIRSAGLGVILWNAVLWAWHDYGIHSQQLRGSQACTRSSQPKFQTLSMSKKLLTVDFPCSSGWPYTHPHMGNTNLMGYKKKILSFGEGHVGMSLRKVEEGNEGGYCYNSLYTCVTFSRREKIFLLKYK